MRTRRFLQFIVVTLLIALLWPRARVGSLEDFGARATLRHPADRHAGFVTLKQDGFHREPVRGSARLPVSAAKQS
jgi:hypothetical protein